MTWKRNNAGGRALRDGEAGGAAIRLRFAIQTRGGVKGIRLTAESLLSLIRISHADRSCD